MVGPEDLTLIASGQLRGRDRSGSDRVRRALKSDLTGFIFGNNTLSTYGNVKTVYETGMALGYLVKLEDSDEP